MRLFQSTQCQEEIWVVSSVVEQLAFNQLVAGSNPARPTIQNKARQWRAFFVCGYRKEITNRITIWTSC
jgi:hypothetical protein